MPTIEVKPLYPEFRHLDNTVFEDLKIDIDKGMPFDRVYDLYPEVWNYKDKELVVA